MALIPDRRHNEQNDDDAHSASSEAAQSVSLEPACSEAASPEAIGDTGPTYRELLEQAGLDLTGHPLADRFDGIADESETLDLTSELDPASGFVSDSTSGVASDSADNDSAGSRSTLQGSDFRKGEGLWTRRRTEPQTEAEIKACVEEIEARQAAWMKKKREEGETPEQRAAREEREAREELEAELRREAIAREGAELDAKFARFDEEQQKRREAELAAEEERAERYRAVTERLESEGAAAVSDGASTAAVETAGTGDNGAVVNTHPLLDEYRWSDLKHIAPEVTDSVEKLQRMLGELSDFTRPMGPDDAVVMLDGLETLGRLTESLFVVTLSVFERVGTPRDYGAKSTRMLIQHRLNVSAQEASRRTQLAEHLGKRTAMSGESIEPEFPTLSAALRDGALSSNQATTIIKCLKSLPPRVSGEDRLKAERLLVEKAPSVRVRDIHALFEEILGWIDPDGQEPQDAADREDFNVNLRQLKDGTWTLKGRLDAETGGVLNGLLTSRIKADGKSEAGTGEEGVESNPETTDASDEPADSDQPIVDTFNEVLSGDRSDCLDPSLDFTQPQMGGNGEIPKGAGVREDGTLVAMAEQQPSVRQRIYERFSSLVGSIEMNRIKAGAAYALVVNAKAEDLATMTGKAVTGVEAPFPITSAALEGLNGSVFFHLMGEKAKSMALATERRLATEKQLAILASRDQGCTFPGCDTPPGWCEAHHIVPWADEGKTDVNNLTLACGAHHHLIDKSDWYCEMLFDGRPAWVPPASLDPARKPILHARFIAREIGETLFN
ncbi:HNH endonuclease signature motif containing protein [Brevibacterium spongiae]|uniref:HNH endonuclease n=1 Tax=Brevibacterium spongiae TaxID=2909672 RepID=A0ABY5SR51_9MICO|nr:HNH endonuclease signature motif containing protein [Brevibacterium spongiae]UVI35526.1 HNH endonuclease [Brevibacterium spongiae]